MVLPAIAVASSTPSEGPRSATEATIEEEIKFGSDKRVKMTATPEHSRSKQWRGESVRHMAGISRDRQPRDRSLRRNDHAAGAER
jgi:hypothetical protein